MTYIYVPAASWGWPPILLIAGLVLALGMANDGPLTILWLVTAGLVGLALGVAAAAGSYFRRRTRRFLASFDPPIAGRHILLCATGTAQQARDLLAGMPAHRPAQADAERAAGGPPG
ncbi:MAG TPA: hypothetical protein VFM54_00845 [Micromonosporaceae bacterium]|nr:hypothetical protein [Micromonosporaceae bacterium]